MNGLYVEESNMRFGPFKEDELILLEKCSVYQALSAGVAMAEFAITRPKNGKKGVFVVEAKSSSPKPDSIVDYDQFVKDIYTKFINAFYLITAIVLKRHECQADEVPSKLASLKLAIADFRFILVINGHRDDWLHPIQDSLRSVLTPFQKMWKCNPDCIAVINDEMAKAHKWIS